MVTSKNNQPPAPKPLDLRVCRIPGGVARWYTPGELPMRREREMNVYELVLMPKLRKMAVAEKITVGGETATSSSVLDGIPVGLTIEESRLVFDMNDTAAWVYLKSWTLMQNGAPRPLPESKEEILDMPRNLHEALVGHAGKILAAAVDVSVSAAAFTPAAVGDEDSPFTDSGD